MKYFIRFSIYILSTSMFWPIRYCGDLSIYCCVALHHVSYMVCKRAEQLQPALVAVITNRRFSTSFDMAFSLMLSLYKCWNRKPLQVFILTYNDDALQIVLQALTVLFVFFSPLLVKVPLKRGYVKKNSNVIFNSI